ncbi:calponin homology domain-containing protein DDB_G0272472-like [Procambarus clarkii]|uniref:calponin homology domain-containing protein DDB_G0272472-like n=1 Tax=Procambarus clarkii TaxID=6728 RepID=UPI0037432E61
MPPASITKLPLPANTLPIAFLSDPASEVGNFIHAKRTELQTLALEYQLDVPHGANKNRQALAAMKLKLELAKVERERQKEAFQLANAEREQQKEALQIKKDEASLRKEEQAREAALKKRDAALQRERKREQLEARKRHLEMQREHDKKQADSVLEYRRRELDLEITHHTQRQQATASLPVSFIVCQANLVNLILIEEFFRRIPASIRLHLADKEETDYIRCAKSADTYSLIHRLTTDTSSSKKSWPDYDNEKPFPMKGVQLPLGNDLTEDLEPSNMIIMDKPQVCDSVVENSILKYVPAEVQENDEVSPPVLVTTRVQAARPQPADSTATAVPQDHQNLPPNLTMLEFHKADLAALKLKLELAKIEREQQKEALQLRKEEAALMKEEQEREIPLKEPLKLKLELAKIEREQQKEALQLRKEEAALMKEEQEREIPLKEREIANTP